MYAAQEIRQEHALTVTYALLDKASEWLDRKYGSSFSSQHPEVLIELAKLIAMNIQTEAIHHQTLQLQRY